MSLSPVPREGVLSGVAALPARWDVRVDCPHDAIMSLRYGNGLSGKVRPRCRLFFPEISIRLPDFFFKEMFLNQLF
jgi:hypothetical protein